MGCDYYVQTELVIEYTDIYSVIHKTQTDRSIEKRYLIFIPYKDSDDDSETEEKKYNEQLNKCIQKNTYKKMLYENETWVKERYNKRYIRLISILCPNLHKINRVYKNYTAWERE
jgi:hypothetical protein